MKLEEIPLRSEWSRTQRKVKRSRRISSIAIISSSFIAAVAAVGSAFSAYFARDQILFSQISEENRSREAALVDFTKDLDKTCEAIHSIFPKCFIYSFWMNLDSFPFAQANIDDFGDIGNLNINEYAAIVESSRYRLVEGMATLAPYIKSDDDLIFFVRLTTLNFNMLNFDYRSEVYIDRESFLSRRLSDLLYCRFTQLYIGYWMARPLNYPLDKAPSPGLMQISRK